MQRCCNKNYVGWFCPRCGNSVSFIDHGGSEPVSVGHLATKNVTINQQLIQGDYIAEGGAKIGNNYENALSGDFNTGLPLAIESNLPNALPPPPADFDDEELLPPPPADFDDEELLPPPPVDFDDEELLPPPPAGFEQGLPPVGTKATRTEQGYEWVEYPDDSDKWFYRIHENDEWELFL